MSLPIDTWGPLTTSFNFVGPMLFEEKELTYFESLETFDALGVVRYSVGDHITIIGEPDCLISLNQTSSPVDPECFESHSEKYYVGQIVALFQHVSGGEKYVKIQWYFRPTEIKQMELALSDDFEYSEENGVIKSNETSVHVVQLIRSKCLLKILRYDDVEEGGIGMENIIRNSDVSTKTKEGFPTRYSKRNEKKERSSDASVRRDLNHMDYDFICRYQYTTVGDIHGNCLTSFHKVGSTKAEIGGHHYPLNTSTRIASNRDSVTANKREVSGKKNDIDDRNNSSMNSEIECKVEVHSDINNAEEHALEGELSSSEDFFVEEDCIIWVSNDNDDDGVIEEDNIIEIKDENENEIVEDNVTIPNIDYSMHSKDENEITNDLTPEVEKEKEMGMASVAIKIKEFYANITISKDGDDRPTQSSTSSINYDNTNNDDKNASDMNEYKIARNFLFGDNDDDDVDEDIVYTHKNEIKESNPISESHGDEDDSDGFISCNDDGNSNLDTGMNSVDLTLNNDVNDTTCEINEALLSMTLLATNGIQRGLQDSNKINTRGARECQRNEKIVTRNAMKIKSVGKCTSSRPTVSTAARTGVSTVERTVQRSSLRSSKSVIPDETSSIVDKVQEKEKEEEEEGGRVIAPISESTLDKTGVIDDCGGRSDEVGTNYIVSNIDDKDNYYNYNDEDSRSKSSSSSDTNDVSDPVEIDLNAKNNNDGGENSNSNSGLNRGTSLLSVVIGRSDSSCDTNDNSVNDKKDVNRNANNIDDDNDNDNDSNDSKDIGSANTDNDDDNNDMIISSDRASVNKKRKRKNQRKMFAPRKSRTQQQRPEKLELIQKSVDTSKNTKSSIVPVNNIMKIKNENMSDQTETVVEVANTVKRSRKRILDTSATEKEINEDSVITENFEVEDNGDDSNKGKEKDEKEKEEKEKEEKDIEGFSEMKEYVPKSTGIIKSKQTARAITRNAKGIHKVLHSQSESELEIASEKAVDQCDSSVDTPHSLSHPSMPLPPSLHYHLPPSRPLLPNPTLSLPPAQPTSLLHSLDPSPPSLPPSHSSSIQSAPTVTRKTPILRPARSLNTLVSLTPVPSPTPVVNPTVALPLASAIPFAIAPAVSYKHAALVKTASFFAPMPYEPPLVLPSSSSLSSSSTLPARKATRSSVTAVSNHSNSLTAPTQPPPPTTITAATTITPQRRSSSSSSSSLLLPPAPLAIAVAVAVDQTSQSRPSSLSLPSGDSNTTSVPVSSPTLSYPSSFSLRSSSSATSTSLPLPLPNASLSTVPTPSLILSGSTSSVEPFPALPLPSSSTPPTSSHSSSLHSPSSATRHSSSRSKYSNPQSPKRFSLPTTLSRNRPRSASNPSSRSSSPSDDTPTNSNPASSLELHQPGPTTSSSTSFSTSLLAGGSSQSPPLQSPPATPSPPLSRSHLSPALPFLSSSTTSSDKSLSPHTSPLLGSSPPLAATASVPIPVLELSSTSTYLTSHLSSSSSSSSSSSTLPISSSVIPLPSSSSAAPRPFRVHQPSQPRALGKFSSSTIRKALKSKIMNIKTFANRIQLLNQDTTSSQTEMLNSGNSDILPAKRVKVIRNRRKGSFGISEEKIKVFFGKIEEKDNEKDSGKRENHIQLRSRKVTDSLNPTISGDVSTSNDNMVSTVVDSDIAVDINVGNSERRSNKRSYVPNKNTPTNDQNSANSTHTQPQSVAPKKGDVGFSPPVKRVSRGPFFLASGVGRGSHAPKVGPNYQVEIEPFIRPNDTEYDQNLPENGIGASADARIPLSSTSSSSSSYFPSSLPCMASHEELENILNQNLAYTTHQKSHLHIHGASSIVYANDSADLSKSNDTDDRPGSGMDPRSGEGSGSGHPLREGVLVVDVTGDRDEIENVNEDAVRRGIDRDSSVEYTEVAKDCSTNRNSDDDNNDNNMIESQYDGRGNKVNHHEGHATKSDGVNVAQIDGSKENSARNNIDANSLNKKCEGEIHNREFQYLSRNRDTSIKFDIYQEPKNENNSVKNAAVELEKQKAILLMEIKNKEIKEYVRDAYVLIENHRKHLLFRSKIKYMHQMCDRRNEVMESKERNSGFDNDDCLLSQIDDSDIGKTKKSTSIDMINNTDNSDDSHIANDRIEERNISDSEYFVRNPYIPPTIVVRPYVLEIILENLHYR